MKILRRILARATATVFVGWALASSLPAAGEAGAEGMIYPRAKEQAVAEQRAPVAEEMPALDLATKVVVSLALLGAGIAGFAWVRRRGRPPRSRRGSSSASHLRIAETRMLGGKQFLVVVEYAGQHMLLGVGPGFVNHLCYLEDASADEEEVEAAVAQSPVRSSFSSAPEPEPPVSLRSAERRAIERALAPTGGR